MLFEIKVLSRILQLTNSNMATKVAFIALALSGMIVLSMQFPYDPILREQRRYQERRELLKVNMIFSFTLSILLQKRISSNSFIYLVVYTISYQDI